MALDLPSIIVGAVVTIPLGLLSNMWLQPALERFREKRSRQSIELNEKARLAEENTLSRMRGDATLTTALLLRDGFGGLAYALVGVGFIVAGFILIGPPPEIGETDTLSFLNSMTRMCGALFPLFGVMLLYAASVPLFRMFRRVQMIDVFTSEAKGT